MQEFVANFHFLRPLWFLALLPAFYLGYLLFNSQKHGTRWRGLINENLLPYLLDGKFTPTQKAPIAALIALWCIAVIGLAGPAWEKKPELVKRDSSAMVILWDLSPSMLAQDVKPSRLVRARLKLVDLLDARNEGLTGLIAYSGDAHVVTPLTDDTKTIKSLLGGLNPAMMPSPGSNAERALQLATELLAESGITKGDIVFLTDGIAEDAFGMLASIADSSPHRITVWGFGTTQGAPIPLPDSGFAKDSQGAIVVANVDHEQLSDAAIAMNGIYIPASNDNDDLEQITSFGFKQAEARNDDSERTMDRWRDQGYWLVLLLLPFAALAFRRGWIVSGFLICSFSPPAKALDWQDLWRNSDQQAQEKLQEGDAASAAAQFRDPQWQAIANYKAGDFSTAENLFKQQQSPQAQYNLGNTLVQQGNYQDAIDAYNKALEADADFTEAKENKAIAEQLLAMQQQQDQTQQDGQQQDGENSEQQSQQQSQEQSQQNSQQDSQQESQQNSEQQSSDQQSSENQEQSDAQSNNETNQQDSSEQKSAQSSKNESEEQAQQQALEDFYQQQEEESQEQGEEQQRAQLQESQEQEQNDAAQAARMMMSPEQREKQQALEQWLRKVPDDPSGLLREKFRQEHIKRQRENFSREMRTPDGQRQEQRW